LQENKCPLAIRTVFDPVSVICEWSNLKLDDWQDKICRGRDDILAVCGRQVGKSTAAEIAGLASILQNIDSLCIIISITQRQSTKILKDCRRMLLKIPASGRPGIRKNTETQLTLSNGSTIMALPSGTLAGGSGLRGFAPHTTICDEASFIPDAIFHDVISPMHAVTRGRMLVITTPNFSGGWCYDLFCSGTIRVIEVRSDQCPRISKKFLDHQRKTTPKSAYRREYECAWLALGSGVFDVDAISRAFQKIPDNPFRTAEYGGYKSLATTPKKSLRVQ